MTGDSYCGWVCDTILNSAMVRAQLLVVAAALVLRHRHLLSGLQQARLPLVPPAPPRLGQIPLEAGRLEHLLLQLVLVLSVDPLVRLDQHRPQAAVYLDPLSLLLHLEAPNPPRLARHQLRRFHSRAHQLLHSPAAACLEQQARLPRQEVITLQSCCPHLHMLWMVDYVQGTSTTQT